jgi:hypothetical protein
MAATETDEPARRATRLLLLFALLALTSRARRKGRCGLVGHGVDHSEGRERAPSHLRQRPNVARHARARHVEVTLTAEGLDFEVIPALELPAAAGDGELTGRFNTGDADV